MVKYNNENFPLKELKLKSNYLECGQILKAHGVHGGMIIAHSCDDAETFCSLKSVYFKENNEYKRVKVISSVPYKMGVLATLEGISSPEEVVKLRLSYLYAAREDILKDEGAFFIADLIGLDVLDYTTGEKYGTLKEVVNCGAQDLYVIKRDGKDDAFIPNVAEFIKEISIEKGILISPIEGMID